MINEVSREYIKKELLSFGRTLVMDDSESEGGSFEGLPLIYPPDSENLETSIRVMQGFILYMGSFLPPILTGEYDLESILTDNNFKLNLSEEPQDIITNAFSKSINSERYRQGINLILNNLLEDATKSALEKAVFASGLMRTFFQNPYYIYIFLTNMHDHGMDIGNDAIVKGVFELAKETEKYFKDNPQLNDFLSVCYYNEEEFEKSEECLKKVLKWLESEEENDANAEALKSTLSTMDMVKARISFTKSRATVEDDPAKTIRDLKEIQPFYSDYWEYYLVLGYAYLKKGSVKKAIKNLETSIQLNSGAIESFDLLGDIYRVKRGFIDYKKAKENYNTALLIQPVNIPVLEKLAETEEKLGDIEQANKIRSFINKHSK